MKIKSLGNNKTEIRKADGTIIFVSYETPVAIYIPGQGYIRTEKKYSSTTSKHINQWLQGARAETVPHSVLEGLC